MSKSRALERLQQNRDLLAQNKLTQDQFETRQKLEMLFWARKGVSFTENLPENECELPLQAVAHGERSKNGKKEQLDVLEHLCQQYKKLDLERPQFIEAANKQILVCLEFLASLEDIKKVLGNLEQQHQLIQKFLAYTEKTSMKAAAQVALEHFKIEIEEAKQQPVLETKEDEAKKHPNGNKPFVLTPADKKPAAATTDYVYLDVPSNGGAVLPIPLQSPIDSTENQYLINIRNRRIGKNTIKGYYENYSTLQTMDVVCALESDNDIKEIQRAFGDEDADSYLAEAIDFIHHNEKERIKLISGIKELLEQKEHPNPTIFNQQLLYGLFKLIENFGTVKDIKEALGSEYSEEWITKALFAAKHHADILSASSIAEENREAVQIRVAIEFFEHRRKLAVKNPTAPEVKSTTMAAVTQRANYKGILKRLKSDYDTNMIAYESKVTELRNMTTFSEKNRQKQSQLETIKHYGLMKAHKKFLAHYSDLTTEMAATMKKLGKTYSADEAIETRQPEFVLDHLPLGTGLGWLKGAYEEDTPKTVNLLDLNKVEHELDEWLKGPKKGM